MMATREILMPDVGEGITEAEITEWLVKVGDPVREDDLLATVMTDKATVEIPSPANGTVASLTGEIGEMTAVGAVIITLTTDGAETKSVSSRSGEDAATTASGKPEKPAPTAKPDNPKAAPPAAPVARAPSPPTSSKATGGKPLASPAVRRRALEAGIDLGHVRGTGPAGRISQRDLDDRLEGNEADSRPGRSARPRNDVKEIKITGLRRKIAERMQAANERIAPITYVEELDVTDLETLRAHLNKTQSGERPKLTVLPFLMLAMVRVLERHPGLNAHFDDDAGVLRQFGAIHIGMATQTPAGLMVPVITHAETRDIWGLAGEAARLADAAKSGTAKREELTGSTITLSSLGALGGIVSTPIINAPEVAIVGVNKIAVRPEWRDQTFVPRKMMNLSSSFDHRIIDGFDAAIFIQEIKTLIENPATLFMEP